MYEIDSKYTTPMTIIRKYLTIPIYDYTRSSPRYQYWKYLERTQYLSEEIIREIQWSRIKYILDYAYINNVYYRNRFDEYGINPKQIKDHRDIDRIPILTKDEIRKVGISMISNGYNADRLMKIKTGGSTGTALELYITEKCSEYRNACAMRHDRWTGWEIGQPIAAVWGNPVRDASFRSKLKHYLLGQYIYLDTMKLNRNAVLEFVKEWKRVIPTLLFGHAHSLYVLAKYLEELCIEDIRPKSIISTSMMLLSHERDLIERVLRAKVFDRYGCEEVSLIASECDTHDGMHMNIEHLYIEFIKENFKRAKPGEHGKIVITDLMNEAMPLIRYRVEDVGIPSSKQCSCGRALPLMEDVAGRTADFLRRRDGTLIAGVSLIENTLTNMSGIKQMQIVQKSFDQIILNIVMTNEYCSSTENALRKYIKSVFDHNVNVDISIIDDIPQDISGKYRFSICEISDN